jgi:hypothetical protein
MGGRAMRTAALALVALAVVVGLGGCRPYTGATPVWAPGYKCRGKVAIDAPASGNDTVKAVFPSSGSQSCVDAAGYRATVSMRVITASNPTGTVLQVPIGPELRRSFTNVKLVRLRLQYKTGCDTAVIDVDAGTARHDPIAC